MVGLFEFREPSVDPIPVLVDVPHAGEYEPEEISECCQTPYGRRKRDFDLYVDQFWADAVELGASMMVATHSRYVLDLNRSEEDVDAGSVQGHPNPVGRFRRGLFWQVSAAGEPVITTPLSESEYRRRVSLYHQPYHQRLRSAIDAIRDRFGYAVLIDAHSMPSVGRDDHPDPGEQRADIVPGTNLGRSCPSSLVALCEQRFGSDGWTVRVDHPYKGGWITRHYGQPEQRVFALQIEVSRRVYMDEESFRIDVEGMQRLRQSCTSFVRALRDWRP